MPQIRRFVAFFWSLGIMDWYGDFAMNQHPDTEHRTPALIRPDTGNLLRGLSGRRMLWALLINALVALLGDQIRVWPNIQHAMISCQIVGLSIMLAWTVASNARLSWLPPLGMQLISIVAGSTVGTALVIAVKNYFYESESGGWHNDIYGAFALLTLGVVFGSFIILTVIARERETRAQAAMHQADAERHLHAKQLLEARLQMMQAQIEPHFLFNTLASVQHLVETEPPAASRMLSDLIKYLRAAMPQMRGQGTTLGREADLARAYLSIQRVRTGNRFEFSVDIPEVLRQEPFPPMMLLTLVENAVKHGFETHSRSGEIRVIAQAGDRDLAVTVEDTGAGLRTDRPDGVGLTNVRGRLDALYGDAGQLVMEQNMPSGVRARIIVPRPPAEPAQAGLRTGPDIGNATRAAGAGQ
jgi:signal transduction histidine kinase